MCPNLDSRRAVRSLCAIRALSEAALTGKVRLTNSPVMEPEQRLYYWRTVLGLVWSHAHEGLGEDIPTPPPVPPDPCDMLRPCPDCPLVGDTENKTGAGQKGGD